MSNDNLPTPGVELPKAVVGPIGRGSPPVALGSVPEVPATADAFLAAATEFAPTLMPLDPRMPDFDESKENLPC